MSRIAAMTCVALTLVLGFSAASAQDIEETKNVQLLKALRRDQLIWTMGFISQSLGVSCDHCHVRSGNAFRYELDEKAAKATARRMITMTAAINTEYFGGTDRVTCASCHEGRQTPRTAAPVVDAEIVSARRAASDPASLPDAHELLAKYERAIGGPAALAKLTTFDGKFTGVTATGAAASGETIRKAPDMWHERTSFGAGQTSTWICNGREAWIVGATGTNVVRGADLDDVKFTADFWRTLKLTDRYSQETTIGRQKLNGRDVYVVRGVVKASTIDEQLFFDADSGLLTRRLTFKPTALGPVTDQADFEDYRTVDGVKMAFVVRSANGNTMTMRTYTEISFNVAIPDTTFAAPPAPPQSVGKR